MKFIFDFDGVLTDQAGEAKRYHELYCQGLADFGKLTLQKAQQCIQETTALLESAPHLHGWKVHGRISAYANEDLLVANVGLAMCMDELADKNNPDFLEIRAQLQSKNIPSFYELSQKAFGQMITETRAGKINPLDPKTKSTFTKILDEGHTITVVSNSSTDRILNLLKNENLDIVDHVKDPQAPLRVRGGAKKFELAETKQGFFAGNYWIDTARPNFEKIIREEKPNVLIGDVFSLDLALPYYLAKTEPQNFTSLNLVLREQRYTPRWTKDFFAKSKEKNINLSSVNSLDKILQACAPTYLASPKAKIG